MNIQDKETILRNKIIPFIEQQGFRVFEFKLFYSSGRLSLRILIDFDQGGISLDDCTLINKKLSQYLDEHSLIEESFLLEVSSPGLRRDLASIEDFLRIKNRDILIFLKEELSGKSYYEAKLLDVDLDRKNIILGIGEKGLSIPIDIIRKAKQKIE